MKKLALISSYCNTNKKLLTLKKNIDILKNLGLDILVFTPEVLPKKISDLCNHIIISEENPQFDGHLVFNYHKEIKHTLIYKDYGYASLNQEDIKSIIKSDKNNLFFKSRSHSGRVYDTGCLFGIFNKINCKMISEKIEYKRYLNNDMHAERTYGSIQKELGISVHEYITEDIMTNIDYSPMNDSLTDDTKIFIDNINMDKGVILIDFYELRKPLSLEITVNDMVHRFDTSERAFYFIEVDEIKNVLVKVNGVDHDFTDDYTIKNYPIKEVKINGNPDKVYIVEYLKEKNLLLS